MVEKNERLLIYVDEEDFQTYRDILTNSEWGTAANLKIFTATVLIGKYIVGEPTPIKKRNTYLRVKDNAYKDDMTLLKCFAVLESDDFNILQNEDKMFSICESYAKSGIKVLNDWYNDDTQDIAITLYEQLSEKFEENLDNFNID